MSTKPLLVEPETIRISPCERPGIEFSSVDGRWLLSFEERLRLPPGRFGIGGFDAAPTYFDDLAVYEKR